MIVLPEKQRNYLMLKAMFNIFSFINSSAAKLLSDET